MFQKISLTLIFLLLCTVVNSQTITRKGNKYGLTDKDGTIILEPVYDVIKCSPAWEPVYMVKLGNKFAYAIRQSTVTRHVRSANWIQSEDYVDSVRWKISKFDFDDLYVLGSVEDRSQSEYQKYIYKGRNCESFKRTYYVMGYSRNHKHGFLTTEMVTRTIYSAMEPNGSVQSDSIQFSLENTTVHPAIYDGIALHVSKEGYSEVDQKIVTLLNEKVGMADFSRNIFIEPQFDTVPMHDGARWYQKPDGGGYDFLRTYYFVRKNGLWGLMYLQKDKWVTSIDCQCSKIRSIVKDPGNTYECFSATGSLTLFDVSRTNDGLDNRLMYQPLVDGAALKNVSETSLVTQAKPAVENKMVIVVRDSANADYYKKSGYQEIYLVNIGGKTVKIFREAGAVYHLFECEKNSLICKVTRQDDKKTYSYLDIATLEEKFSFTLPANAWVRENPYNDPYAQRQDNTYLYGEVLTQKRGESEKTMGYYNFNTQTFSKSKPPRFKNK